MNDFISQHPSWIRGKLTWGDNFKQSKELLRSLNLNSVCVEAACPNKGECWQNKHVTFLILGDSCTRGCSFCNIGSGSFALPDKNEPYNIVRAVKSLGSRYVVITSVTRDDLEDQGAGHFIEAVNAIKKYDKEIKIELLIPDLNADNVLVEKIADSGADVIGHNIEMPEVLYPKIRPRSSYKTSLQTLKLLSKKKPTGKILTKTSIIVGLGESYDETIKTFEDIYRTGVDILYIGQYLSPSGKNVPVEKFYSPKEFEGLKKTAEKIGVRVVFSGPMVRSSYKAYESFLKAKICAESLNNRELPAE